MSKRVDEDKKNIVRFLTLCNKYSKEKIKTYRTKKIIDLELQKKIEKWESYHSFNLHAISELKENKLDNWLS